MIVKELYTHFATLYTHFVRTSLQSILAALVPHSSMLYVLHENVIVGGTVNLLPNPYQTVLYALKRVPEMRVIQIPSLGYIPRIDKEEWRQSLVGREIFMHGSMTINLAGSVDPRDPSLEEKQEYALRKAMQDVRAASVLGCKVIFHCGSCRDKKRGMQRLVSNIRQLQREGKILLENGSGGGNKLCCTMSDFSHVLEQLPRVGACIDTCHLFAAGEYDFTHVSQVDKFFWDVDKMNMSLELIHLNDSQREFGSGVDRHAPLTKGYAFTKKSLTRFLNHARERSLPLVSEVPDSMLLTQTQREIELIGECIELGKYVSS